MRVPIDYGHGFCELKQQFYVDIQNILVKS